MHASPILQCSTIPGTLHCKNGNVHGKEVGAGKGAGKRVGEVAGEIEWCLPAKEEVLEAVKKFQLSKWSNKGGLKVRKSRCRKKGAAPLDYDFPSLAWALSKFSDGYGLIRCDTMHWTLSATIYCTISENIHCKPNETINFTLNETILWTLSETIH